MNSTFWFNVLNSIFFVYACLIFSLYIFNAVMSVLELRGYLNKNKYVDYKAMQSFYSLPTISVIAPAHNEEKTIVENVKCLLRLHYQDFEIIIVNDGSTDRTLDELISYFNLVKVHKAYDHIISTQNIKGVYQSLNPAYNHLIIIDKENGGKADSLNAGINMSQKDLFLAIDVDCIIEQDALLKMVKPFMDNQKHVVIAAGGVIRIANSCEVSDGKIHKVNYPKSFWAKFQVIEYFRAFTLSRMAWSKLNGLLIISGAFGLFDRARVLKIGGYDSDSVGEDLELVVRLRRYMHEHERRRYKVAFIPDPLCWTEVPESYKVLKHQRTRWTRGAIDTILKHKKMFLNPKYGLVGMLSFPNWVFFEWLAPVIQFIGLIYFFVLVYLKMVDWHVFIALLAFVLSFSLMYSMFSIFFEAYTYHKYKGSKYLLQTISLMFLELVFYQPLNMFFSLIGHYQYYSNKNKKQWGNMSRKGFK